MELEEAKKYLPVGETHYIKQQYTNRELALYVSMFFLTESDRAYYNNLSKEQQAEIYWAKKEVAYQVIKKLIGNGERIPTAIQTEKDWERYFMFGDQESNQ